ncbi:MAG: type I restriction enzyme HsdR N-terminal domain-containing protein [Deltaproteobacteria bacterium]|nr:type I restriction enzyme HsdR N-terminal domain-containing protein [Deltaproteobacteria bacterium]
MTCLTNETIIDFLTGREFPDSDDEQIRQRLERLLIEEKGYGRDEAAVGVAIDLSMDGRVEAAEAHLVIKLGGRQGMVIQCARGSMVTRHREALSLARLIGPVVIPFAAVTNGRDAEVLDTATGSVIAAGLAALPDRVTLMKYLAGVPEMEIDEKRRLKEKRILAAFSTLQCPTECEPG